jgi:flagellar basal-body rod protein FlgF
MQEIAVLASRVLTTQREFTAVADNVANVNTAGFRKLSLNFKEVMSKPGPAAGASYVADRSITMDQTMGTLQNTGNHLDFAINGSGFFAVDVNGATQYTRRGQFVLNSEGTLVTPEGYPVLDNSGAQIQFPQDAKNIQMAEDGTFSTEQGQLAQVGVYTFSPADVKLLQRAGNTNFIPRLGATPAVAEAPVLRQGYLESSNVNAVQEMVNMQNVSKAYENSLNLLRNVEDLEQRAIRTIGTAQ